MQSSGMVNRGESNGRPDRSSRLDRIRPGESLVLFPLMAATAWSLVVAVFASISQLFGPEDERATWGDVVGAALANFVMVFALTFAISAIIRVSARRNTKGPPPPAEWGPPTSPLQAERSRSHLHSGSRECRRVARGATIGALPGLLLAVVPLLLHDSGVISSDQSQIGFIGLPILVIGTVIGSVATAAGSGSAAAALLGCGAGFAVGLTAGSLVAAATGLGGIWLFAVPLGMIVGAALATCLRLRHTDTRAPGEKVMSP